MDLFRRLQSYCQQQLYSEYHSWPNWIILAFLAGVVTYFILPYEPNYINIAAVSGVIACCAVIAYWASPLKGVGVLLLITCLFTLGLWRAAYVAGKIVPVNIVKEEIYTTLIGKVEDIELKPNYKRILLSDALLQDKAAFMVKIKGETLGRAPLPGFVRITTRMKDQQSLRIGDIIKVRVILTEPPIPIVPGSYNARRACFFRNIKLVGVATSVASVITPASIGWRDFLADLRLELARAINEKMGVRYGNLTAGLMLGMSSAIDKDIIEAMRNTGLAHILAVSGLHMTVVCGCVFLILRALFAPLLVLIRLNIIKLAAAVSMAASGIYLLLTGVPVAALRAWLMSCGFMVGIIIDRPTAILRLLGVAALVIVWRQPVAIMEPSFQMSFSAVLALITSYPIAINAIKKLWRKKYQGTSWWHKLLQHAAGMMISTVIASCATAPFAIYHFHRQPLWGAVSNLIAIPLTTMVIMPLIVITLLLYPIGGFQYGLSILSGPIKALALFALYVEGLGEKIIIWPHIPFVSMAMIVGGGLWWSGWRSKWRIVGLPVMVMGYILVNPPKNDLLLYDWRKDNYAFYKEQTLYVSNSRASKMVKQAWQSYTGAKKIRRVSEDPDLASKEELHLSNRLTAAMQLCKLEVETERLAFSTLIIDGTNANCSTRKWQ